jgi:hypothetical protein
MQMDNAVERKLETLELGDARTYRNLTILPLVSSADGVFRYGTLAEAVAEWEIALSEVSVVSSPQELKVVSRSNRSVLLLQGEELAGARRNRVLNASVLLKEMSETRIPVSCVERPRGAYSSRVFRDSGNLMAHGGRSRIARSVHRSLERSGTFDSDTSEIRHGLARLRARACAQFANSSLSDIYSARADELRQCVEVFKPLPDQVGLLAIIDGQPAGMDVVSLRLAYTHLHTKLARSYALEALLSSQPSSALRPEHDRQSRLRRPGNAESSSPAAAASPDPRPSSIAQAFLAQILAAPKRSFLSIGYGTDLRYGSPYLSPPGSATSTPHASAVCGSALVHKGEVIHGAFFRLDATH